MRTSVAPMHDILLQIMRSETLGIPEVVKPYFRDVSDHISRTIDIIDVLRDTAGAAMNVNMALVNYAQGEVVKKLAGWAALLALPTLVTSWYGMNFEHMPELRPAWAYPALIGVIAVACVVLYRYLKKVRWL